MLNMLADMAGLAPSGDTERGMLRLDDEMAGLTEAADTPAGQDGTHSSKPEPVSSAPGESQVMHSTCCASWSALPICSKVQLSFLCSASVDEPLQC